MSEISLNVARGPIPREPIALRGRGCEMSEISLNVARGPVPREPIALRGTGFPTALRWNGAALAICIARETRSDARVASEGPRPTGEMGR